MAVSRLLPCPEISATKVRGGLRGEAAWRSCVAGTPSSPFQVRNRVRGGVRGRVRGGVRGECVAASF